MASNGTRSSRALKLKYDTATAHTKNTSKCTLRKCNDFFNDFPMLSLTNVIRNPCFFFLYWFTSPNDRTPGKRLALLANQCDILVQSRNVMVYGDLGTTQRKQITRMSTRNANRQKKNTKQTYQKELGAFRVLQLVVNIFLINIAFGFVS